MRIVLSKEEILGNKINISGEKARYLISVMRCNKGDLLQIIDGEGGFYRASIAEINGKDIVVDLLQKITCDTDSPLNLVLVQGILKGEKMDMIVQKATELGVKEIIPVITDRSQIRETRKSSRWRKIAEEASRQSGRAVVPVINDPVDLSSLFTVKYSGLLKGFIFWEEGGLPLKEAVKEVINSSIPRFPDSPVNVFVGPEGGFTKEEVNLAESKGLVKVSLGKRILRAETAAISAVTLVQFLMGDLNI